MQHEERTQRQRGMLLLVFAGVSVTSLILFPVNESVEKVAALSNATMINNTGLHNPVRNKNPIYQASGWTLGVTKLKSAGFPEQAELIFENGTMNGAGKVTNLEMWIISLIGAHGLGNGVITTKDKQMVFWTAHDIGGTNNKNGTATYWGDIIFHGANSSSSFAFLNTLRGYYITEANGNNQTTKIWKSK